jgi:hypothetical protein
VPEGASAARAGPALAGGKAAPAACRAAGINDSVGFVNQRVRMLKSFAFLNNGYGADGRYHRPVFDPDPPREPYFSDLRTAFETAPDYLAEKLCTLTQFVFIDPQSYDRAPYGWSYWEVNGAPQGPQADGTGRYIAVVQSVWNPPGLTLAGLEQLVFTKVLNIAPGSVFGDVTTSPPSVARLDGRPDPLFLVAILAREIGLMINFQYDVTTRKDDGVANRICNGNTFQSISWKPIKPFSEKGHIHLLGEEVDPAFVVPRQRVARPSDIRRLYDNVFPQDFPAAAAALAQIYGVAAARPQRARRAGQAGAVEWANMLATATPDDDFVETYRMVALQDAGVTALNVTFLTRPQTTSADVIANLDGSPLSSDGSPLSSKVSCVRSNFAPMPGTLPKPYRPAPRGTPAPNRPTQY